MKLKRIMAGIAAASLAVTSVAATAVSAGAIGTHKAYVVFADSSWFWGCWGYDDTQKGYCADGATDITGDGTYTVYIDKTLVNTEDLGTTGIDEETGEPYDITAVGVQVFCVDIEGLADELGLAPYEQDTGVLDHGDVTISGVTVKADGAEVVTLDDSAVTWGNIEGKGNLRIELANAYGITKDGELVNNPGSDPWGGMSFSDKLEVTFTISGMGGGDAADTEASADDDGSAGGDTSSDDTAGTEAPADTEAPANTEKPSTETGAEGIAIAAGVAVLAAGAAIVAKKRK